MTHIWIHAVHFRYLFLLASLFCSIATAATAEKRVALVIGNSAYMHVGRLTNPVNDAAAIEAVLKKAGFDNVESRRDLSIADTRKVLREFTARTRDADVAVIYYAGHGIEVDGTNYIIPVDATLEQDTDIYDEAFSLERILVSVEPAKQLRLVILDACRDNPFAKVMKRTIGARGVSRGLAKVEPTSPNTMIAFAAKAGSTASDGASKNSPFATALVDHLAKPGLDLRRAFGYVRDDVMKATENKQEPYVYGSLGGDDVSLVPALAVAPTPVTSTAVAPTAVAPLTSTPAASNNADARRDYEAAVTLGTQAVWDAFIIDYPKGLYTELARAQRAKLVADEVRRAAVERSRAADEEKARLAAEGARAADLAKAAREAKAADNARMAAETKKAAEDARLAEAERVKAVALAKATEEARLAAEKKTTTDTPVGPIASLAPEPDKTPTAPAAVDIPRQLQTELRRVGCKTGAVTDEWNGASQRSLELFNKHAGAKLDVKVASLDAVDLIKSKPGRICPLICERGYKVDGERCTKITCRSGYELGDDNSCERIETKKPAAHQAAPAAAPAKRDEASSDKAAKPGMPGWEARYARCRTKVLAELGERNLGAGGHIRYCVEHGG